MSVYVLVPVFNRLAMTKQVIECLRTQQLDEPLHIIVIDDGSTDGTGDFLSRQKDVNLIKGDGTLWWGGTIEVGLQAVLKQAKKRDWVLFVNNDTLFNSRFVMSLLETARSQSPAAVGSVICDENSPNILISIGASIDTWRLQVVDKLKQVRRQESSLRELHEVDALSGRGVLFPVAAFHKAGTMRPRYLPHYLADYELSIRIKKAGYRLLVSENAAVLSANEFGASCRAKSLWDRFFSVKSSSYLPAVFFFWWQISNGIERLTLLPRLIFASVRSMWGSQK